MRTQPYTPSSRKPPSHALRYASIYICFLLLCLTLSLILFVSSSDNAQENYWAHHAAQLSVDASITSSEITALESYARQLSTDSTFVRLTNMDGLSSPGFVYTAYTVMNNLAMRQYGLANLPVKSHIYLPRSGYVISSSQFTTFDQFYRYYLTYPEGLQEQWRQSLSDYGSTGSCFSLKPFGKEASDYILAFDISSVLNRKVPAIVWYELDTQLILQRFLASAAEGSVIMVTDERGVRQLVLTNDGSAPDESLLGAMVTTAYSREGMAAYDGKRLIRRTGSNGWQYTLALPQEMCTDALGNYTPFFLFIFFLAIVFGSVLVFVLVRMSMRPVLDLSLRLHKAQDDKEEMQRRIEAQRPMLCMSYLRTLLSGHVSSNEEFSYIMKFLGYEDNLQYFVLFANAYAQQGYPHDEAETSRIVIDCMKRHLTSSHPFHHYTTLTHNYVVLLAFDESVSDPLMDLQQRIISLHNELAEEYSIWFFAGVGNPCAQPQLLWESYEQARDASRYTAKSHIFLPYAHIRKDQDSWYYPVEISAKLLHFITTGNRQQVAQLFTLIHRENLIERRLSAPLLNYLLSDLKNTLLKARFQASQTPESQTKLEQIDRRLAQTSVFPELEEIAILLCGFFTSTAEPSDPIPDIKRYIDDNFADPSLCLSKLSGLFNISESYLSHLFKDRTGENFSVYLETLRMDEAARRMRSPDCNLSTLYIDLGYSSAATWRRAFKKRFGITPSEMLRQLN